jgi:hypothetical protein
MTYSYVPPEFGLYELDDEALRPVPPGRRAFHGWNGLAGEPAEEVSLGWRAGDAAAFVSTSQRPDEAQWARLSAAQLALGGDTLGIPGRPRTTQGVAREIQRIGASAELWSPGPVIVPGGSPADVAVCEGFCLAYSHFGPNTVLVAAVGLRTDQLRVRKVRDWSDYDFDATQVHALSDLSPNA